MINFIVFIIVFFLLILGLIGAFLPIIPGPLLSFLGLLIIHFFTDIYFEQHQLLWYLLLTILVFTSDYFLQYFGVKSCGGGKYAIFATIVGAIIGFFFSPIGLVVGPFLGAFIGSLMDNKEKKQAIIIAFGSLMAFVFGTLIKLCFSIYIIYIVVNKFLYIL